MNAILGIFPDRDHAQQIKEELGRRGLASSDDVALLTQDDIGSLDSLLNRITPAATRTRTGVLVGLITGGILGLILGTTMFPTMMVDMDIPGYTFGLLGMIPFGALGAYLGSLYGSRSATRTKIQIKERLGNDDGVLVIARTKSGNEQVVLQTLESAGGILVSSNDLPDRELKHIIK